MESKNVCLNYLRFCSWLDFVKIEGPVVSKNSYTVFLSTLEFGAGFYLSVAEKLAYFIHLFSKVPALRSIVKEFSVSRQIGPGKLKSFGLTEHDAESYCEWLVDLDVLAPTKPQFGGFLLTPIGASIKPLASDLNDTFCTFATNLLGREVQFSIKVPPDHIWHEVMDLTKDLSSRLRSPVDPNVVSVLPILLHLQVRLITSKGIFTPLDRLVSITRDAAALNQATLTWDSAYRTGFLRFR